MWGLGSRVNVQGAPSQRVRKVWVVYIFYTLAIAKAVANDLLWSKWIVTTLAIKTSHVGLCNKNSNDNNFALTCFVHKSECKTV